jgi:hypothetical protein
VLYYQGFAEDITLLKEVEKERRQFTDELEKA